MKRLSHCLSNRGSRDARLRRLPENDPRREVAVLQLRWLCAAAGSVSLLRLPLSIAGSRSGSTSVWHSRRRRLSSIRKGRTAPSTSIAARRSNAASKSWLSEGTRLQYATGCARVMAGRIRPPRGGGENGPVFLHLFCARALESRTILIPQTSRDRSNPERFCTWTKNNLDTPAAVIPEAQSAVRDPPVILDKPMSRSRTVAARLPG